MRFLFTLSFSLLTLLITNTTQSQTLEWAKQISGFGNIFPNDIQLDSVGHVFVSGFFSGTADFDQSSITSNGGDDAFLAKYDTLGNLIWVRSFGGALDEKSRSIAIDSSGSVVIVGSFESAVDFNPDSSGSFISGSKGGADAFISKFDSNGNWIFTIPIGGTGEDFSKEVVLDNSGNIFVTGAFERTVNFNPNGIRTDLSSPARDGFMLALTASGGFRWVTSSRVSDREFYFPIAIDAQQGITLIKNVIDGFYIQKITSSTGNVIWEKQISSVFSNNVTASNITIDRNNNIVIGGYFYNIADLDPSTDTLLLIAPSSASRGVGFIAKYNSSGEILFASGIYQHSTNFAFPAEFIDIEIDSKNNIRLVGAISVTTDFDPSEDSLFISPKNGSADIIYAAYGPQGELISVNRTGENSRDAALALVLDQNDNTYSAGYFSQTVDFDPDPNQLLYFTAPSIEEDGYFRKLSFSCFPSFSYQTVTECNGYRLPNGRLILQNGTYKDTLTNAGGCDSILSFEVTLIPVDTSVTTLGLQYISNANSPNTFYQWVDCNDHFSSIPGATGRTFEPTRAVGSYAVIVLQNNCADTSQCYGAAVGIEDQLFSSQVSISPNPTKDFISVNLGDYYQNITIEVTNIAGQTVAEHRFSTIDNFNIQIKGNQGIYLLKITTDTGKTAIIKVHKE